MFNKKAARVNIRNGYFCESADTIREAMKNFTLRAEEFSEGSRENIFYIFNVECLRELLAEVIADENFDNGT